MSDRELTPYQHRVARALSRYAKRVYERNGLGVWKEDDVMAGAKAKEVEVVPKKEQGKAPEAPVEPTGAALAKLERSKAIAARIVALGEATSSAELQERVKLAEELEGLHGSEQHSAVRFTKIQEHDIKFYTLRGMELHPNELGGGTQTCFVVDIDGGEPNMLLGELMELTVLRRYPAGARVMVRSLGMEKSPKHAGRKIHKFKFTPPPPAGGTKLPFLGDFTSPADAGRVVNATATSHVPSNLDYDPPPHTDDDVPF